MKAYDSSNTTEAVDSNLNLVSHKLQAACKSMRTFVSFVSAMLEVWWGISPGTKILLKHDDVGRVLTWFCNGFY